MGLVETLITTKEHALYRVSILVIVEMGLVALPLVWHCFMLLSGFNPCYSGNGFGRKDFS